MKKRDHSQLFQALANIGVIFGIVFLAIEIQQSNRIARATIEIELQDNYSSTNSAIYTDINLANLLVKCKHADVQLTEAEEEQAIAYVYQAVNNYLAVEQAYVNGLVAEATYAEIEDDARSYVNRYPGLVPFFRYMLDSLPAQSKSGVFQTLEELLAE